MLHHQLTSANDSVGCLNRCLHVPTAVQLLRCEGQTPLEMNLYRSFGNLMEAWMTEGTVYSDSNSLGNSEDSPTPSSDMETNLRSESVDSGVETASSDTSFHATSYSVSADNAEIDAFVPEGEGERLIQTSTSQSPALSSPVPSSCSSSSPHFCPRRPQGGPGTVHLKVEQALQRTYFKHQRDNPLPLTVEDRLRRQPQASFLPQRHTMDLVRGQRSQSFSPGRTANSSVPIRPMSKMCRRPMSMNYDRNRLEVFCEEERTGLSPGLDYLEQVCQMLEEVARQQMHNRALQTEEDALREHQDTPASQALNTCPGDSEVAEQDLASCERLENVENAEQISSEQQQQQTQRPNPYGHFRRRSASDTNLAMLHLRNMKTDYRGQPLSADELLEENEEDEHEKEGTKKERNKSLKNLKLKIGSLRRGMTLPRDTNGQEMQSSEKTSARRRLSQLFRRRRKTVAL